MRRLAAALGLLLFLAQAASAGWMVGRIIDIRAFDRGPIVRVDWQYPWQLPPRFRNHCRYEYFAAASILFRSLRQRLQILLLLGSLVWLLSSRPRLLRPERFVALPLVGCAT